MTNEQTAVIREQASTLAANLQADLVHASTRLEHMRLTQLAEEAERLVAAIDTLRSNRTV